MACVNFNFISSSSSYSYYNNKNNIHRSLLHCLERNEPKPPPTQNSSSTSLSLSFMHKRTAKPQYPSPVCKKLDIFAHQISLFLFLFPYYMLQSNTCPLTTITHSQHTDPNVHNVSLPNVESPNLSLPNVDYLMYSYVSTPVPNEDLPNLSLPNVYLCRHTSTHPYVPNVDLHDGINNNNNI